MARVRVVEPVVVVGYVVRAALRLHTEHVGLARIPEAVVADGDVLRVAFHVGGTVALGMVATAVLAIELISMVNPDVGVVGIERDGVIHATHDGKVAELDALGIAYQETKTVQGGIIANALEGHVQFAVSFLALDLQALCRAADVVEVVNGNQTDETESNGCGVVTLLIGINNGLDTCACGDIGILGTRLDSSGDGLGCVLRHVEHFGTSLQCTVAVIGTWSGTSVDKGKALTRIVAHFQVGDGVFLCSHFSTLGTDGHNLHGIRASLQSHRVSTSVGTIVTYQLCVNLGIVCILSAFYIDVIILGTVHQRELHVGRLQPATSLDNLNDTSMGQQRQTRKQSQQKKLSHFRFSRLAFS